MDPMPQAPPTLAVSSKPSLSFLSPSRHPEVVAHIIKCSIIHHKHPNYINLTQLSGMTIREPITPPPENRGYSYGSLFTSANDIEADLDINEAEPRASFPSSGQTENANYGRKIGSNVLLGHGNHAPLASLPYELPSTRCALLVISLIATVFVLTCKYGLLFTTSDVEDMTGKIFAGFIGFVVFPLGVVESVRYLSRLDEQARHYPSDFASRQRFMAWNDMKTISQLGK
jgi:hypothetical protein